MREKRATVFDCHVAEQRQEEAAIVVTGGMGIVYRAEDTGLGRQVALDLSAEFVQ